MHSHLAKMIGVYLLEERTKKRILQKDVAEQLGLSAQFLGRIEKGEVMAPEASLVQLIQILGLSETKMVQIYRTSAGLEAKDLFSAKPTKIQATKKKSK